MTTGTGRREGLGDVAVDAKGDSDRGGAASFRVLETTLDWFVLEMPLIRNLKVTRLLGGVVALFATSMSAEARRTRRSSNP